MKELPISIQTFEEVIEKEMTYVDKTMFVSQLINKGKYYFLSRPRRFGKSLLLTTLKSFFEGKKELFEGLYIYDKEKEWATYPVIQIDYSFVDYKDGVELFRETLLAHLQRIAADYGLKLESTAISSAFIELCRKLHEKYKKQVVILVDEYDKPMIDVMAKNEKFEENREILRSLYANFKGLDSLLRFVMLTGVSRFSKVSVFSGMNNLYDLSNDDAFSCVVGFTQEELEANFAPHLMALSDHLSMPMPVLLGHIKTWYNGFSFDGKNKLYNPFSVLTLLKKKQFNNYWFSTGTPTFLMDIIKKQKRLPQSFEGIKVTDLTGSSMQLKRMPLIPLLYQTGYLTIESTGLDGVRPYYHLNYPNEEVKHSFLTFVTAAFKEVDEFEIQPEGLALRDALREERIDDFINRLQSFLADIPARLHIPKEAYYHSLTYLILRVVGFKLILEKETDKGRIDAVLELPDKIYIIEFKFATNKRLKRVATLSQKALRQIEDRKYYEPYLSEGKRILLLGVGFLNNELHGRLKEM